jgi:hypothetical protein
MELLELRLSEITPLRESYISAMGDYRPGSAYTATSLIMPARQLQFQKRYSHLVSVKEILDNPAKLDAWLRNKVPSVEGTALHNFFEYQLKETPWKMGLREQRNWIVEYRARTEMKERTVSAQMDAFDIRTSALWDYKRQSIYARKVGGDKWTEKLHHYELQLNINAYLLGLEGLDVKSAYILAVYKDWQHRQAGYRGYPKEQFEVWSSEVWPKSQQEKYMNERLDYHIANESVEDDLLPECSKEDYWDRPSTHAVCKVGRDKALTLLTKEGSTFDAAVAYILKSSDKEALYIRRTVGSRTKCDSYCDYNTYCNQYKAYIDSPDKPGSISFYYGGKWNSTPKTKVKKK